MNPRHLAIAAASLLGVLGLILVWWWSRGQPAVPTEPPAEPAPPPSEPPPELPSTEIPLPPLPDPNFVPAPLPSHVDAPAFNQVIDQVRATCGLGVWQEVDRVCDELRCSLLVSVLADDSKPYPTADGITGCPAWLQAWGPRHEGIAFRVECPDGDDWDIALIGPHTERIAAKAAAGEPVAVSQDEIRARVCGPTTDQP